MVSPHQYGNLQLEHAWLTNVQTSLLSDAETGYAAAMVEYANALLNRDEGVVDRADTRQPVLQLQVGSWGVAKKRMIY